MTIYRDGSRDEQVLSTGSSGKPATAAEQEAEQTRTKITPRKRPDVLIGSTRRMKTGCGNIYITINEDEDGNVFEVFTSMGKSGGCASSQAEAMGRLISLGLRSNLDPETIITQLKGVSCHQPSWQSGGRILSCADAIAKCLEQYTPIARQAAIERKAMAAGNSGGISKPSDEIMLIGMCPECGGTVEHEGGCAVCHNCGFTKCG